MKLLFFRLWNAGLANLRLIVLFIQASGGLKTRLQAVLGASVGQRAVFAILRAFKPRLSLRRNFIACYPAEGSLILTLAQDVNEVLGREADFSVVYEPRMRKITNGPNFFLGMQDGPEYQRDVQAMRRIVMVDDVAQLVLPMVRAEASKTLTQLRGQIDLPSQLSARIPAMMVQRYFGLHTMTVDELIPNATAMFHYLFSDLNAEAWVEADAMVSAALTRQSLDAAVTHPLPDTLISRAVEARSHGELAFQGEGIRNNMIGIVIGAIPTLSKAACFVLDELLRQPKALAGAAAAARTGDEARVATYLWEALRFNPPNPVIYRRAVSNCWLGTHLIAKDTMVLAANLSSMHDEAAVPNPGDFLTDRPWSQYLLWGRHVHLCFGDRINHALLPALLTPLLALPGLRRAPGDAGQIDGHIGGMTGDMREVHDTPYPRHFVLEWDSL